MLNLVFFLIPIFVINFDLCSYGPHTRPQLPLRAMVTQRPPVGAPSKLDGSYELVSETLTFEESHKSVVRRTPEWVGLWMFQNGRFSQTLMKKRRQLWISEFPRNPHDLGFDSCAGSFFIVSDDQLVLSLDLPFFPDEIGRPATVKYQLSDGILTLTEDVGGTKESTSRGQRITVLRRNK